MNLMRVSHRFGHHRLGYAIGHTLDERSVIVTDDGEVFRKGGLPWDDTGITMEVKGEFVGLALSINAGLEHMDTTRLEINALGDRLREMVRDHSSNLQTSAAMPIV